MGSEKIILDIPYYSQYLDVDDPQWKARSCGIVCLKMVMDYYKPDNRKIIDLVNEGVAKGGYCQYGWIHNVLVKMANERGLMASRKEYKSQDDKERKKLERAAIKEITSCLKDNQPVIVSAVRNFSETDKFHLVVLTGFEKKGRGIGGFYYNDPDSQSREEGKNKFVPIDVFKKHWRKMAIYVKE